MACDLQGMRKEGLGVYTYPSGARYEGEWRDNLKEGRGVYFFPTVSPPHVNLELLP